MDKKHWDEFLAEPTHTQEEWDKAYDHANNWVTCSLGSKIFGNEACIDTDDKCNLNRINSFISTWIDDKEENLGMDFFDAIGSHNIEKAREAHKKIYSYNSLDTRLRHLIVNLRYRFNRCRNR